MRQLSKQYILEYILEYAIDPVSVDIGPYKIVFNEKNKIISKANTYKEKKEFNIEIFKYVKKNKLWINNIL